MMFDVGLPERSPPRRACDASTADRSSVRPRAVLGESFNSQHHRYQPAVAEFANAANRVARNAIAQGRILRRSCISVCGKPFLDGKAVATDVKNREPSIAAAKRRRLTVVGN